MPLDLTATYTVRYPGDPTPTDVTPTVRRRTARATGERIITVTGLAPLFAAQLDDIADEGDRLHTLTVLSTARIVISDQEYRDWDAHQLSGGIRRNGLVRTTYAGARFLTVDQLLDVAELLADQIPTEAPEESAR